MASELVSIDGQPLSGNDRNGSWKINNPIAGWWETPAPRRDVSEHINADGDIPTSIYYGPREVTLNGRVISSNHDYLHQAASMINAIGFRGNKKLYVQGHGPSQWAMVDPRPGSRIRAEFVSDRMLRFEIPLEAVDPFKYGESRSFSAAVGSSVDVFHRGTVPAWPVATVTGSLPSGYSLSLGGRTVTVTKSLASGSTHTVDMRTGILRENGSRVYGSLGVAKYFTVKPGSRQSFSSSTSTGSGTVTLRFNDTYI